MASASLRCVSSDGSGSRAETGEAGTERGTQGEDLDGDGKGGARHTPTSS